MEMQGLKSKGLCRGCPAGAPEEAASSAIVRREGSWNVWTRQPPGTAVHLAALFRDPGIADGRPVKTVLDLRIGPNGELGAGKHCWVQAFLEALSGLPQGLTVALDNGVRCPTPKQAGSDAYYDRAAYCHERTKQWLQSLPHPNGGRPALALCDKDLACGLAKLGVLTRPDGTPWHPPGRFVDAVGENLRYLGLETIVLAHPSIFGRRWKNVYGEAFKARRIVERLVQLAAL
jgi:hypothetical protein